MHIVENNKIQNACLIFIEVESLAQQTKLENDYEEFCSLVSSCDTKIKEKIKLNQKIPSTKMAGTLRLLHKKSSNLLKS